MLQTIGVYNAKAQVLVDAGDLGRAGDLAKVAMRGQRTVGVQLARQIDQSVGRMFRSVHLLATLAVALHGARDDDVQSAFAVAAPRDFVQSVHLPQVFGKYRLAEHLAV